MDNEGKAPIPICSVCEEPMESSKIFDVELGPCCKDCKVRLRWAHAWLNRPETGIKGCTVKFNLRA